MSKFQTQLSHYVGNVQIVSTLIPQLTKAIIRPLIQLAVLSLEGAYIGNDALECVEARVGPSPFLPEMYATVLTVIQLFLRSPKGSIKIEEFKAILKDQKFSIECVEVLSGVLYGTHGDALALTYSNTNGPVPQINSITWRMDISLAHSAMAHLTQPTIIFQITLSDGEVTTFKTTISQFHKLRHSIARLLQDMRTLENRNILKHF